MGNPGFSARGSDGLTLIELLVTLSVAAILLLVGVPSYNRFITDYQLGTDQQKLRSLLSLARSGAVHSGVSAVVCRWDRNSGCSGYAQSGSYTWQGALLFIDENGDKQLNSPEERVIRVQAFEAENRVSWNRGEVLVYQPDGSLSGGSNGTFALSRGEDVRTLVISLTGRVR
ncbi:GspH/FimT family pseudopilin [Neptuniibacter halophilus]|uniref:GspH/FimT family pseudopilin n=1 Tax=Neptuniibacter halophilus TaxID=651666 RepID=UPI0025745C89|nr:GspH/FimT family pseudopilin [Neptuniibacter halophilus]